MKRKKCRDGKNCGATCINRSIVCRVDLGAPLSGDLSNVSRRVESAHLGDSPALEVPVAGGRKFMEPYRERFRLLKEARERATSMVSLLRKSIDGESDTKKQDKLLDKMMKFLRVEGEISRKERNLMGEIRSKLIKTNLSDKEVKEIVDKVIVKSYDLDKKSRVKGIVEEFVRMFNGRGVVERSDGDEPTYAAKTIEIDRTRRAFAERSSNFILTNGELGTTFHELGHFVEFQSKSLYNYAKRWRDSKALTMDQILSLKEDDPLFKKGGYKYEEATNWTTRIAVARPELPIYKLNKITDINYDNDEETFLGRYVNPYMGRIYARGQSTEVISMTLEGFSSAGSMVKLYRNHSDLFEMAVGLAITPISR